MKPKLSTLLGAFVLTLAILYVVSFIPVYNAHLRAAWDMPKSDRADKEKFEHVVRRGLWLNRFYAPLFWAIAKSPPLEKWFMSRINYFPSSP